MTNPSSNSSRPAPGTPIPEGAELVDSTVLAQLRRDAADASEARAEAAALRAAAEAGREAQAELRRKRHEALVDNAIRAGKFGPARRAGWLKALQVDEAGTVADLEALPAGLIPVAQVGHAGEVDGDEAVYARAFPKEQ